MITSEMLHRNRCFAALSEECRQQVAKIAEEKTFLAGERLCYEHDPARYLYVIVEGEVDLHYLLGNGEQRTVDHLTDGDLLGWSALVEPYRITGIATAAMDTRVVAIEADKLRDLCEQDPALGRCLMAQIVKLLARRLVGARMQLADC